MTTARTVKPTAKSGRAAALLRKRVAKKVSRDSLNMRVDKETRSLIDDAATAAGKSLTNFVLDAARHAAQETLLDRTEIVLDEKSFAAFRALLDAPPKPNANLRKTLLTPAAWD